MRVLQRNVYKRQTSEKNGQVSRQVLQGSLYCVWTIARIYRSVMIQSNEVKCVSNKLRFIAGEGWKAQTSNLPHSLWTVSEHQRMQDPKNLVNSCAIIQE